MTLCMSNDLQKLRNWWLVILCILSLHRFVGGEGNECLSYQLFAQTVQITTTGRRSFGDINVISIGDQLGCLHVSVGKCDEFCDEKSLVRMVNEWSPGLWLGQHKLRKCYVLPAPM